MSKELFLKICKLAETDPDKAHQLVNEWCERKWKRGRFYGLQLAHHMPEEAKRIHREAAIEDAQEYARLFMDLPPEIAKEGT